VQKTRLLKMISDRVAARTAAAAAAAAAAAEMAAAKELKDKGIEAESAASKEERELVSECISHPLPAFYTPVSSLQCTRAYTHLKTHSRTWLPQAKEEAWAAKQAAEAQAAQHEEL
jgi:hypothetical protein